MTGDDITRLADIAERLDRVHSLLELSQEQKCRESMAAKVDYASFALLGAQFALTELRATLTLAQQGKAGGVAEIPTGTKVSVDVSTGDEDFEHRIFATVIGVERGEKPVILCEEESRNFAPPANPPEAGAVVCAWTYDADSRTDAWETGCGNLHAFTADGPAENNHRFCPYCGGNLVIAPQPKDAT